eukprot:5821084-Amphidinium_carterae.1
MPFSPPRQADQTTLHECDVFIASAIKLGEVIGEDGGISRPALSKFVVGPGNAENLKKLEARASAYFLAVVFPLVDASRDKFINDATCRGEASALQIRDSFINDATSRGSLSPKEPPPSPIASWASHALLVLDIPLLFERGSESLCDAVLVCSSAQLKSLCLEPAITWVAHDASCWIPIQTKSVGTFSGAVSVRGTPDAKAKSACPSWDD